MENFLSETLRFPKISEQPHKFKKEFEEYANGISSIVVTEENCKEVKNKRAELNKAFEEMEKRRKSVKAELLKPYNEFQKVYDECVTDVYKQARHRIDEGISVVEKNSVSEKREKAEAYFYEYANSFGIDFIGFNQTGIKVNLTATAKKLREESKAFIDKVVSDIETIKTQAPLDMEILYEYKKTLNLNESIKTVKERHNAIENERVDVTDKIDTDEQDFFLEPPTVVDDDEITVMITVTAPRSKIVSLKKYMDKENIRYE